MKLALRPVAKKAPPRPRRLEASTSSITVCGSMARAFASAWNPPAARYSASFVRSRSSAPARTIDLAGTELLHDRGHVRGRQPLPVAVVDSDDRAPAAAARALDRAQGHVPVRGPLARVHA